MLPRTDIKADLQSAEGENNLFYTKERRSYITWSQRLGILAILVAIAAIVLNSIHIANYSYCFIITLLITSVVFFIASIVAVYWANKTSSAFPESSELFQPKVDDKLTKVVFFSALILAGASAAILPNLYVQAEYSPDYALATGNGDAEYFRTNFIIQSIFFAFFFLYFLLVARAAFKSLKWDNNAITTLIFLGNTLFLLFGFGIIFYANHAFSLGEIPNIRTHFPVWNVRSLYILGLAIVALAFIGFLVDHRSWRVGFFVLSFLLLLVLISLVNFTGYAFRHTRQTYEFYKGSGDVKECTEALYNVHQDELLSAGCPAKYTKADTCKSPVPNWENPPAAGTSNSFCVNVDCCGFVGRVYSDDLLTLANYSLLAIIAGTLISIGCYYFWYVTWVDKARDAKKDYVWLAIMAISTVAFMIVYFTVDLDTIREKPVKA